MRSMEEKRPKTGGRRQTLSEDTKKANNNASKRRYHAHHKNISVSKRTHALLVQYQKKFGFKSAGDAVHALLKDFAPDLENSDEDSPIDAVEPELTVHGPELPPDMKSRPPCTRRSIEGGAYPKVGGRSRHQCQEDPFSDCLLASICCVESTRPSCSQAPMQIVF